MTTEELQKLKPTRVEVIQQGIGRDFTKWLKDSYYEISIQDDGKTIKLFETKETK